MGKNQGDWLPPETKRSSGFGHAELAAKDVKEEVEVRDIRVLDRGRAMDLRAPNTISFNHKNIDEYLLTVPVWNQISTLHINCNEFKQKRTQNNKTRITNQTSVFFLTTLNWWRASPAHWLPLNECDVIYLLHKYRHLNSSNGNQCGGASKIFPSNQHRKNDLP